MAMVDLSGYTEVMKTNIWIIILIIGITIAGTLFFKIIGKWFKMINKS